MTNQEYILNLIDWESTNGYSTVELVKECFNCRHAEVLPSGDIVIADPQNECLLSDEALAKFVAWHQAR
jgi:hypothetical protein